MKKILLAVVLLMLFFLTLFPRGIELINHNYLFLFDQGREYVAAKGIVVDHKFILIGTELGAGSAGISGIFHGPVYYYLLSIPFALFHGDPYGGMILMFLFSVAAIIAGFFLGKNLWGLWWGLFVAFLFIVSPPLISQARFIWSPNPPTVFIVIAFFFIFKWLKTKKNWYIFWAAFFSGFIYNFEFALAIPMVCTLLVFLIVTLQKKVKYYVSLMLGFFISFLPMIFFEIRHNFMALRGVLAYLFVHKTQPGVHSTFLDVINGHWGAFLTNVADTFPNHGFISSSALLLILLGVSIWYLLKEKDESIKHFFLYILLLLPVTIIIFGFLRNAVYHYYLTDLNIVYMLLFSYCFYSSWQKKHHSIYFTIGLYSALLVYAGITSAVQTYSHDINDFGGTAKIKGLKQSIDYIYQDSKGAQFGVLVFAPPVYTYQYDYMLWWYGERKYHYVPYAEKKGTVYLLIEVDPAKPWSYQGWLDTVIKTGTILQTKTLSPSGFIVQKRQF